ncbi:hypothetical protein BRADI_2g47595v3 [Brachypodium distachyon]|uniref:Uncharacterized protein n=1 Tax=Brachypodium distachyon TaxID=15368 RepID=A0A2K2DEH9_BRADI|nr:hypothetical protein BRADI_2g47595v3 [Brachypodium distachyon]
MKQCSRWTSCSCNETSQAVRSPELFAGPDIRHEEKERQKDTFLNRMYSRKLPLQKSTSERIPSAYSIYLPWEADGMQEFTYDPPYLYCSWWLIRLFTVVIVPP